MAAARGAAQEAGLLRGGAGRGGVGRGGRRPGGRPGCHHQPAPAGNWRLFPAGRPKTTDPEPAAGVGVATGCGVGKEPLGKASPDQSRLAPAPDPVRSNSRGRSLRRHLRLRLHRRRGRGRAGRTPGSQQRNEERRPGPALRPGLGPCPGRREGNGAPRPVTHPFCLLPPLSPPHSPKL